jgi:hypothetical protein
VALAGRSTGTLSRATWFFETWPALLLGCAALIAGLWSGADAGGSGGADSPGADSLGTVASGPESADTGHAPMVTTRYR